MDESLKQKFIEQSALSKRVGTCLVWRGSIGTFGYGRIKHNGQYSQTHRLAYEIEHGQIPADMCVLHSCDNPPCHKVSHLFLGTKTENAKDRDAKARQARGDKHGLVLHPESRSTGTKNGAHTKPESRCIGESNGRAALTAQQVLEIRSKYSSGTASKRWLSDKYGVSFEQISNIIRRKSWRHL